MFCHPILNKYRIGKMYPEAIFIETTFGKMEINKIGMQTVSILVSFLLPTDCPSEWPILTKL